MQNRQKSFLHIITLRRRFCSLRIYRVMTYHYHPFLFCYRQNRIEPRYLLVDILLTGIRIFLVVFTVF